MSTCEEAGSDVYALNMEFATRRVERRSEIHSNESQDLAEGSEVARLRRRVSFVLEQALLFRWCHHLCRQGMAFAAPRQLHSQTPVTMQANCTERVTRSERQKGANGNGNGNGNGNSDGDGDEAKVEAKREQGWMRVKYVGRERERGRERGRKREYECKGGAWTGMGTETRAVTGTGTGVATGTGAGVRTVSKTGKGTRMKKEEWEGEESSGSCHIRKK